MPRQGGVASIMDKWPPWNLADLHPGDGHPQCGVSETDHPSWLSKKIPRFAQNLPVLCGFSVFRREFAVWQVMDTTRLSAFPGWVHPAEWRGPVVPVLLSSPSEQNAAGLQGRGETS